MQISLETDSMTLSGIENAQNPFPHFSAKEVFRPSKAKELYDWFETNELWLLTETNFYTQYEFSLVGLDLPPSLSLLNCNASLCFLVEMFQQSFNKKLKVIDITAHKLVNGHKMGIHNDFIGKNETHRLVIQINSYWEEKNGGYLMLFNSKKPQDVSKVVLPLNNTAIGFEISEKSYHAVSMVYDFTRYTLVYTFNEAE